MTMQTKLVDVTCRRPIRLRNKMVRGVYHENLTISEIADCISQYAMVEEILPSGAKVVLDFTNYDKPHTEEAPVQPKKVEPEVVVEPEVKTAKETKKEEVKEVVEETPVEEATTEETVVPETTIKDEEVVEDADEKVAQAKKTTKGKK